MSVRVQITFDCADPARLAAFWAEALDYKIQDPPEGHETWEDFLSAQGIPEDQWNSASAIVDAEDKGPRLYFQQIDNPKTSKNRVHLDLNVSGGHSIPLEERREQVHQESERLCKIGATIVRTQEERGEYWMVMQDPEGNEFCLQ